ncbi:hypothetical protein B0H10DRAFT_597234 [Mycena sp. CBHHK59/15]|nr:hypothetical protein B0H10DRAFT_597234 [Mycena sp. CBHHK59/15]
MKLGNIEISTLLDCAVLSLLPAHFSPPPIALKNAVEFRSAGTKGLGAFATQDIRAAALIHVEYPTTVMQNTVVLNFGMTMAETYRELVRRVPGKSQPELLKLNNSQPLRACEFEEGILRSNAIGIGIPTPVPNVVGSLSMGHNGLFLETSRFNHSCSPNSVHHFDPLSFTLSVHTLCPITKGEEIVHSYIDLTTTVTRDARRARLQNLCHFKCMCERCVIPDAAVEKSDKRRQTIHDTTREQVLEPLLAWHRGNGCGDLKKVISFHLAAVEDMKNEGLYHFPYSLHVSLLAICFAALEDVRSFRSWMGKARDVAISALAAGEATEMLKYIMYPETFPQWALGRMMRTNDIPSSCKLS